MDQIENTASEDKSELFIMLLSEHERALLRYVLVMLPNANDAEDILQESKLVMWRHFGNFEQGSNFKAWARKIIFNRILAFRKKKGKESNRFIFSDQFYEVIENNIDRNEEIRDSQNSKLLKCINKLPHHHKEMIHLRYNKGYEIEEVAQEVNKTVAASYKIIARVREILRDCVRIEGIMS
ncbi:MAG: sigma-70 family RNA polymerase sigma factor [Lentisphaeraceae bacterium]|nr:sigma-70 family RNA polymerase sigma factor [Lentisphaeraceae bacterium]